MEDLNAWTLIVGAIMPMIVAFVVQTNWSQAVRTVVGTAVSLGAAAVTYGLTEGWAFDEGLFVSAAAVLALSAATLTTFWKDVGLYEWWRNLTSLGSSPSS